MAELRKWLLEGPPALRLIVIVMVAVLAPVAPAMAMYFTWLGGSGEFSDENDWGSAGCIYAICYPHTTDDDALIADDIPITVALSEDLDIDDLTLDVSHIEGGLTFTAGGTSYTISPDSVTIKGTPVVMTQRAGIITRDDDECSEE